MSLMTRLLSVCTSRHSSRSCPEHFAGRDNKPKKCNQVTQKPRHGNHPSVRPTGTICVGFVARSVEGKDFKNTPKLPKSKILFNLHRVRTSGTAYVGESSFEVIKLHQQGYPSSSHARQTCRTSNATFLKYFNQVITLGITTMRQDEA